MPDRIDELEAQAALHRAGLAAALSGLVQGAQPTALMGTDLAQTAVKLALDTARRNPVATALVGVGVVMMLARSASATPQGHTADGVQSSPESAQSEPRPESQPENQPENRPDAQTMRQGLHKGLGHLPPEARQRVIRKRIEALKAQEEVEQRPTHPLAVAKRHPWAMLLAAAGLGLAATTLWPRKGLKARQKRDQTQRAAETQMQVEEARIRPFPDGPTPTHHFQNQDRI